MHQITRHNDDATILPVTTIHLVIDIKLDNIPTDESIDAAMTALYPTLDGIGAIAVQVIKKTE